MPEYVYQVTVEADTEEQADTVMAERILPEEDYGFDYGIVHVKASEAASSGQ